MTDLLTLRERRYQRDRKLQKQGTVVSIKANVPGADKRFLWSDYAVYVLYRRLTDTEAPVRTFAEYDREGLVFTLVFSRAPEELKKHCVRLEEEHPLGRLVDLDVQGVNGPLTRTALGYPRRRCYLCDEEAVVCSRSGAHAESELRERIRFVVCVYLRTPERPVRLARCAEAGLLSELCREYGFGCVTVNETGSHDDMDFFTFLRSLPVVAGSLMQLTGERAGDFHALRAYGRGVEEAMFRATGGINTHKGAVFLYLMLGAAYLRCENMEEMAEDIRAFSGPLREDFDRAPDTHGLSIYSTYGIRGIRGEALRGFPALQGLQKIPETPCERTELTLSLLVRVEDTSAIHRGGIAGWKRLKALAGQVREGSLTPEALDRWCSETNISTGGAADLVGAVVFLALLSETEQLEDEYDNR